MFGCPKVIFTTYQFNSFANPCNSKSDFDALDYTFSIIPCVNILFCCIYEYNCIYFSSKQRLLSFFLVSSYICRIMEFPLPLNQDQARARAGLRYDGFDSIYWSLRFRSTLKFFDQNGITHEQIKHIWTVLLLNWDINVQGVVLMYWYNCDSSNKFSIYRCILLLKLFREKREI